MEQSSEQDDLRRRKEQDLRIKMAMQKMLEPAANERLNNIRISSPEMYEQLVQILVTLYQQGRIQGKVSEEQLKALVARVLESKREPKITFARK